MVWRTAFLPGSAAGSTACSSWFNDSCPPLDRSWINCLLIREVPFSLATRLWDTYLAEGSRLKGFLIYVAAAFLLSWSRPLRTMDFQVQSELTAAFRSPPCCRLQAA